MDGDNALSSAKRVSREPPRHDGMVIASFTEHGERQEAGRIRGGCCPGGSVWTCTSRSEEDDVKGEQVQRDRQEQRAQQMREEGPSPLLLALQQSQSQPTENVPSAPTLAARIPQVTPAPHPLSPRQSQEHDQSGAMGRRTAHSQPADPSYVPPELQKPPRAKTAGRGRAPANTLPPQARPPDLSPHQRLGRRVPVQSLPSLTNPASPPGR